jgi:hypothetical protein
VLLELLEKRGFPTVRAPKTGDRVRL